jgi:chromosome segregation ATPase
MFKKLKRLNTTKASYPIQLDLRQIRITKKGSLTANEQRIQIAYIKKGVVKACSQLYEVGNSTGSGPIVLRLNDVLNIRATMYKDNNGVLQEKVIEFVIRDKSGAEIGKFELKINDSIQGVKTMPIISPGNKIEGTVDLSVSIGEPVLGGDDDDSVMGGSDYGSVSGDPVTPSAAVKVRSFATMPPETPAAASIENERLRMKLEQALVDVDNVTALYKDCQSQVSSLQIDLKSVNERHAAAMEEWKNKYTQVLRQSSTPTSAFTSSSPMSSPDNTSNVHRHTEEMEALQNSLRTVTANYESVRQELDFLKRSKTNKDIIDRYEKQNKELEANSQRLTLEKLKALSQLKAATEKIKTLEASSAGESNEQNPLRTAGVSGSAASAAASSSSQVMPSGSELQIVKNSLQRYQQLLDDERSRTYALKTVLMKFVNKFSRQDNDLLFDAGIILACSP